MTKMCYVHVLIPQKSLLHTANRNLQKKSVPSDVMAGVPETPGAFGLHN